MIREEGAQREPGHLEAIGSLEGPRRGAHAVAPGGGAHAMPRLCTLWGPRNKLWALRFALWAHRALWALHPGLWAVALGFFPLRPGL